jgi:N-ethylmaleimide reductase
VVHGDDEDLIRAIRRDWVSKLLLNRRGADLETRINDVTSGLADVITVGTQSLANPALVERIKSGAPLNDADRSTFYVGGERGYIDYPTLDRTYSPAAAS